MPLFDAKPISPYEGFERVDINNPSHQQFFKRLYKSQSDVLYNHSPIYPFAYLNVGTYRAFLPKEGSLITLVAKNFTEPILSIHAPRSFAHNIWDVVQQFDSLSKQPIILTDLTEEDADIILANELFRNWKKVKTSMDVIQNTDKLTELNGRNFSSLRNTLRRVERDYKPDIVALCKDNYKDAIKVFENWKEKQGKKYFRVTVGRDIRLIEEYHDKIDFSTTYSYVYYISGVPSGVSFGCRSYSRDDWGMDITVKADVDIRGLADFAFVNLMQRMNEDGIIHVNDSGYHSKGVKVNKFKFQPEGEIPMFNLVRK